MRPMLHLEKAALTGRERLTRVITALGVIPLVGYIHYWTGPGLEFHPFFLLPIIVVTWYGSVQSGVFAALFSAGVWSAGDWLLAGVAPSGILIVNEMVRLAVFIMAVFLVAQWRDTLARESLLAQTEPLTGLANRRAFFRRATVELARAQRSQHPVAVLFFDLDGFKSVNDTLGHEAGDDLLTSVAEVLRTRCRAADISARLGGDEFAVLLPETGPEAAKTFAEMLRQRLLDAMQSHHWPVTFSIGVAVFIKAPEDVEQLISRADALMYSVKHGDKDGIRVEVF